MGSESESADSQGIGLRIGFTDSSKESGRLPIPIKLYLFWFSCLPLVALHCVNSKEMKLRESLLDLAPREEIFQVLAESFIKIDRQATIISSGYRSGYLFPWIFSLSFRALSIRNYGIKVEHKKLSIWESETESGSELVFWNRNRHRFVGSVVH